MMEMKFGEIVKRNGVLGKLVKDDKENFLFHPAKFGRYFYHELEIVKEADIEETTDFEKVEYLKLEFTWGEVVMAHLIGDYVIVEYIDDFELKETGKKRTLYHPYINFKNTSRSYESLDSALIGVIVYKYDGDNSQAGTFFERMIDIEGKYKKEE